MLSMHTFKFLKQQHLPVKLKVTQSCPTLCDPRDYTVHGILQASPGDLPTPWIEPRSPTLQVDSLPAEP